MKARPIIFNGDMVRAILDGRKTQTRRAVRGQLNNNRVEVKHGGKWVQMHVADPRLECPYGQPGDLLYVRETFALENTSEYHGDHSVPSDGRPVKKHSDVDSGSHWIIPHYRASDPEPHIVSVDADEFDDTTKWTPSIHMPRWASRITLEIAYVRVERLRDISESDEDAEGIGYLLEDPSTVAGHAFSEAEHYSIAGVPMSHAPEKFGTIAHFNSIGLHWDANPWVWVIEFRPILKNVDEVLRGD